MKGVWVVLNRLLILGLMALSGLTSLRAGDEMSVVDRLVNLHLPYVYGSGDVAKGGLDCSGFVQIVFREAYGIELPDEADKQLDYCRQHGQIWDSTSEWTPSTLRPGDLIFYAGPYDLPRESRVTHVMIYRGNNTMAGAQGEGRQKSGVIGGVGEYYFQPHYPSGVYGESGERFIGHRRVFAYGRLNITREPEPQPYVAAMQKAPAAKTVRTPVAAGAKPAGVSSPID